MCHIFNSTCFTLYFSLLLFHLLAKPQLCMVLADSPSVALWGLTNPSVTQVYGTCPDRRPITPARSAGICTAHKKGGFSPEQEGLRKQKEKGKMNTSLTTFFSLLNQSRLEWKKHPSKHPFIKHTTLRCMCWKEEGDILGDRYVGRSVGTGKLERMHRDIQCTNRKLCSTSPALPPPSLPPCVYMWGPSRLEALPGPRCSLSTPRFQRGSRALQQQAAHTASAGKDQEPGEDNLLHINTDLPVSCLSHWFCFLTQDGP